jgi:hypothetical protein
MMVVLATVVAPITLLSSPASASPAEPTTTNVASSLNPSFASGPDNRVVDSPPVVDGDEFSNVGPITIPTTFSPTGEAIPYPSPIDVAGLDGNIAGVTVTLSGLSYANPQDLDLMLVAPSGANLVLMTGVGSGAASDVNLLLSDSAATFIPLGSPLVSGTFKPTAYAAVPSGTFPSPAPSGGYRSPGPSGSASFDSQFGGSDPNGTWSLYVITTGIGVSPGTISGGWSLNLSLTAPPVVDAGASTTFLNGGPPVPVDPGLNVTDGSSSSISGATVSISGGFLDGDTLNFTNQDGITGSFEASQGVLTLTGSASVTDYIGALESVSYGFMGDASAAGTDESRTIAWVVTDAVGYESQAATSTIDIGGDAVPTLTTTPSATQTSTGATLQDQATLSSTGTLDGTGSITFDLYGPSDPGNCSTTPVYTEVVDDISTDGPFSTTTGFVASASGTYNWTASFTGDTDDTSANSTCGAETVTVVPASVAQDSSNSLDVAETTPPPTVTSSTTATGNLLANALGLASDPSSITSISDKFNINGATPVKGVISTYGAYGHLVVQSSGPNAGAYNYSLRAGPVPPCSGATDMFTYTLTDAYGQSSTASLALSLDVSCTSTPTISTTPNTTATSTGATLQDQATLSNTGTLDGTGSITFDLYGPSDPGNCSTTPVYTETVNDVSTDGPFSTTTGYVATTSGTYNWTASFTGDTDDTSASSTCGAETVTVVQASQAQLNFNNISVFETTPPPTVTYSSNASGNLLANATGLAGDPSSITSVSDATDPGGVTPVDGVIAIDSGVGDLVVQTAGPNAGDYYYLLDAGVVPSCSGAEDSFTFTLTDDYGQSSSASLAVAIVVSCRPARPSVTGLSTDMGPVTGGTPITVTGSGFSDGATVAISQTYLGVPCTGVDVLSPTKLTCVTRGNVQRGLWNLTVTTSGGTSAITSADQFTYYTLFVTKVSPSSGPAGTHVTISGDEFAKGAVVFLGQGHGAGKGSLEATGVKVVSPNEITAVIPKGAKSGTWNVFVVEPGDVQTPPHPADRFTYT